MVAFVLQVYPGQQESSEFREKKILFGHCAAACEVPRPVRMWRQSDMTGQQYVIIPPLDLRDFSQYLCAVKAASNEPFSSCFHSSMSAPHSFHTVVHSLDYAAQSY